MQNQILTEIVELLEKTVAAALKSAKSPQKVCILVLGDQLFPISPEIKQLSDKATVFMAEDYGLCTHFQYHQQKLVFFLSAMRHYRDELEKSGFKVAYQELSKEAYEHRLEKFIESGGFEEVVSYEISDRFFESKLDKLFSKLKVKWTRLQSPAFLTPRSEFKSYLESVKKPWMNSFYTRQRKRLDVLMNQKGEPQGGQWSFDAENRESLPANIKIPALEPKARHDSTTQEVIELVSKKFGNHPGNAEEFWLPVDRKGARECLKEFIHSRLKNFGQYEDALSTKDPFLFHAVISPFMNSGLLTPQEVIDEVLKAHRNRDIPMNSIEGFIRQVIGWREFMFGIDQNFGKKQSETNHFNHKRYLTEHWYEGTTGLLPLDDVIKKANRWGYAHHIERLMVAGNFMLLSEIHPKEAYRWFMEMFIDSADWVMGPNVFGMGIHSDGGIFATKPYICGSNYLLKMSDYSKGPWCDIADGLYWSFIGKHKKEFAKNPRMSAVVNAYDRLSSDRLETLHRAAQDFKDQVTRKTPRY